MSCWHRRAFPVFSACPYFDFDFDFDFDQLSSGSAQLRCVMNLSENVSISGLLNLSIWAFGWTHWAFFGTLLPRFFFWVHCFFFFIKLFPIRGGHKFWLDLFSPGVVSISTRFDKKKLISCQNDKFRLDLLILVLLHNDK